MEIYTVITLHHESTGMYCDNFTDIQKAKEMVVSYSESQCKLENINKDCIEYFEDERVEFLAYRKYFENIKFLWPLGEVLFGSFINSEKSKSWRLVFKSTLK